MDIVTAIVVAIAVTINVYILYCMIRDHIRMLRMEKMIEISKHYEWLNNAGLIESSMFFNKWGLGAVGRFGYPYE